MRAAICRRYGPPEVIEIGDFANPVAADGEVVVAVRSAAVNFPDVLSMADEYQRSTPLPYIPGSEFAGHVVSGGADHGFADGNRVYGTIHSGAFAEYVTLPVTRLQRMPDSVDFDAAAGFGVAYTTAYHALRTASEIRSGDWVVVLGAAGGVGLATVDLARHFGARVIAAASGDDKLALCLQRGAEAAIDYRTDDLRRRIKAITGEGAHVVVDPVGGPASESALRALRRGGTFVTVGYASGEIPAIPLNLVLLKGITITSVDIGTMTIHHPEVEKQGGTELHRLFAAGALTPYVHEVYPLAETAAALRHVADRKAVGKVIIRP
ncbi:NADPH:quinone reductase-like Zn-dependent oxidoreductase [Williamsia muralis]|uniref:NADPH:quinone reductase-like Zn-dependent oxidoreductase n=1 Tax=Williamsia marianensis TaxID=85044 RepID=A0A495K8D8_WILMA|nr:NADPH:quinone oxidoreductase family protein [Williamsia muralis]RKR97583.1 NADPH:quinone reductase-like Zn-dependent oxidoreductase [Williamsia muralis]